MPVQASKSERKLVKLFKALDASQKETLLSFAEFLFSQSDKNSDQGQVDHEIISLTPLEIPRPENESVIKAIKRLSETYPMVNKDNILHPISDLMTAHMLQGKEAEKIIDELEAVFLKEYQVSS